MLSTNALIQEINALKSVSSANMALLSQMSNINKAFYSKLQDDVSEQAVNIINDAIKIQIGCYEFMNSNAANLSHASDCLLRYEQINF